MFFEYYAIFDTYVFVMGPYRLLSFFQLSQKDLNGPVCEILVLIIYTWVKVQTGGSSKFEKS